MPSNRLLPLCLDCSHLPLPSLQCLAAPLTCGSTRRLWVDIGYQLGPTCIWNHWGGVLRDVSNDRQIMSFSHIKRRLFRWNGRGGGGALRGAFKLFVPKEDNDGRRPMKFCKPCCLQTDLEIMHALCRFTGGNVWIKNKRIWIFILYKLCRQWHHFIPFQHVSQCICNLLNHRQVGRMR